MDDRDETMDETVPLQGLGDLVSRPRASLLVYHHGGVEAVALEQGRGIVIGRAPPADLAIPDPSLSRQHTRFRLRDGSVEVEDLDSTNGTWVNGELVTKATVEAGDSIRLGQVVVSVHELANPIQGVEGRDRFTVRLEEETDRARFFGRTLAVLMVRPGGSVETSLNLWCPMVQQSVRAVDRVGLFEPGTLAILMPEASGEEARRMATTVAGAGQEHALRAGIATFPDTATSATKLLEITKNTLDQTDEVKRVLAASELDPGRFLPGASEGVSAPVIRSEAMRKIFATVDRLAKHDIPVLIVGETGTGKEIVAQAVHERGNREGPMRCINCAAIPDQLLESALFGHEKGAFTSAAQRSKGVFEEADGGTVMLDEVGELSPSAQAALLRVLETKRISRVGSSKEIDIDVRVVAATHRNLEAMCSAGTFRLDLFYRLNTLVLEIPSLRDRPEEIEPLAHRFLETVVAKVGSGPRDLSDETVEALLAYRWPGNVRELRNEIDRAVVVAEGDVIEVEDLSDRVRLQRARAQPAPLQFQEGAEDLPFRELIQRYESHLIREALQKTDWNQAAASRELGIPVRTLTSKIKAYGLRDK